MAFESRSENDAPLPMHQANSEKLRNESAQLLASPGERHTARRGKTEHTPNIENGSYTIKSGDTLSAIASRMLKLRGETATAHKVYEEVERIIDLNREKYPWLEKNAHKIKPGMSIKVWDSDTGPDPSCTWKDWKTAEPGRITVAQKCESVFAGKDSQVIVAPGGRAVFTSGSQGFVAPRGFARAISGSRVTAIGGDIVDDGGELQILHPEANVRDDNLSRLNKASRATNDGTAGETMSHEQAAALIKQGIDVPPL